MDYQEALDYITKLQTETGSEYTLDPVIHLCEAVGRPDRALTILHIAGTNGKGSIGYFLSNILAQSGYKVARYVSPTILDYRERIQLVCGQSEPMVTWIPQEDVARHLTRLRTISETMPHQPTAFEIETVMAFLQMKEWNIDVAIVECGMGGALDATNIIDSPLACIFSKISLDHTAILGDTLLKIATQKFGIIKPGTTVFSVLQNEKVNRLLSQTADQNQAKLILQDQPYEILEESIHGTRIRYQNHEILIHQPGRFQIENALVSVLTALELKDKYPKVTWQSICNGLKQGDWSGRMQVLCEKPYIIVDGAHNPAAAKMLRASLERYFPDEKFTLIMGVFRDKEYNQMFEYMFPVAKRILTVTLSGPRGLSASELKQKMEQYFSLCQDRSLYDIDEITACDQVDTAVEIAKQYSEKIMVFGSLSYLSKIYEIVQREDL